MIRTGLIAVSLIVLAGCANGSADAIRHGMEQRQAQPATGPVVDSVNDKDFRV